MDLTIRRLAVFVTRDWYVSAMLIDAVPSEITMAIKSRELARDGQELTFRRISPVEAMTPLYEEEPMRLL